MSGEASARRLWQLLEGYHAVVYFAPESQQALAEAGLKGRRMAYFAGRAAPMGAVPAEVVVATFYNFSPAAVRRAIPDAWQFAPPDRVLAARLTGVDRALRHLLGEAVTSPEVAEAAALAEQAAHHAATTGLAGRPLFAANAGLPRPHEPHLRLWQAATTLREHRGDGHLAALLTADLDGCEALVTHAATGAVPAPVLVSSREWTAGEWSAAEHRLVERGLLDTSGRLTPAGQACREEIEATTDRLASSAWEVLDAAAQDRLAELVRPLAATIAGSGLLPGGLGRPQ